MKSKRTDTGDPNKSLPPLPTPRRPSYQGRFLAAVVACLPMVAGALESDSRQPMYIEANSAAYDEKKGQTVYTGDVKATQGSLEVFGDQMTVYQRGGKTEKIVVTGNPSRLKQTPDGGKEDMHGTGQRSEYFPDTGILILYDKALVWQGKDTTASDRIEYDTRNGLFKAGQPGSGSKRVHVTLHPKEESAPPANDDANRKPPR